jgi:Leucine-rich repeat (LRR) protein
LTALEELWLGKNKITEIKGLDTLTNLKILSIQSNRLTSITGLSNCTQLEELHISHNALTEVSGLENNVNLKVIDISSNPIEHLSGFSHLNRLQELWASNCETRKNCRQCTLKVILCRPPSERSTATRSNWLCLRLYRLTPVSVALLISVTILLTGFQAFVKA